MMISDQSNRTVHVPPWPLFVDDHDFDTSFPYSDYADDFTALHRYLPSSTDALEYDSDFELTDSHTCDEFRMFEFKIRKCVRARSHDWTDCPYAHPGEKARRRDPRKYNYSGVSCPEFRKGNCRKGELCEFAHGVFECWLHPSRYRTQACKDGLSCTRKVCFFAHAPEQLRVGSCHSLRVLPSSSMDSYDGSPLRLAMEASFSPPDSPSPSQLSPVARSLGSNPVNELVASLRQIQLGKVKSMPSTWNVQVGSGVLGSPLRPGFCSVPTTPTRTRFLSGGLYEEEPVMERVESGRNLREKMFEKLRTENSVERSEPSPTRSGHVLGGFGSW